MTLDNNIHDTIIILALGLVVGNKVSVRVNSKIRLRVRLRIHLLLLVWKIVLLAVYLPCAVNSVIYQACIAYGVYSISRCVIHHACVWRNITLLYDNVSMLYTHHWLCLLIIIKHKSAIPCTQ